MNSLTIRVEELDNAVGLFKRYKCENVTLTILEPEEDMCGDIVPATLVLSEGETEEYIESIGE